MLNRFSSTEKYTQGGVDYLGKRRGGKKEKRRGGRRGCNRGGGYMVEMAIEHIRRKQKNPKSKNPKKKKKKN